MITIKDLIQELTDATEGSRELDLKIAYVTDFKAFNDPTLSICDRIDTNDFDFMLEMVKSFYSPWSKHLPSFTTSLDGALSLIPTYETEDGPQHMDFILEHVNGGLTISAIVGSKSDEDRKFGSTDALAICIAALHARSRI